MRIDRSMFPDVVLSIVVSVGECVVIYIYVKFSKSYLVVPFHGKLDFSFCPLCVS